MGLIMMGPDLNDDKTASHSVKSLCEEEGARSENIIAIIKHRNTN